MLGKSEGSVAIVLRRRVLRGLPVGLVASHFRGSGEDGDHR